MFIQGVSLRYIPVQYGWSVLSFSLVIPKPKQWFWASNQSYENPPVRFISVQNGNKTADKDKYKVKLQLNAMLKMLIVFYSIKLVYSLFITYL